MTDREKENIMLLQSQGYGYKRIATELGLAVNGVKSFCRRHPIQKDIIVTIKPGTCQQCGNAIIQTPGRKTKRFCSDKCRNAWWNIRPNQVKRKAFYTFTCQYCGGEFQSYGNKNRVFCSRKCFADARRKDVRICG